jgi:hypothetical protein
LLSAVLFGVQLLRNLFGDFRSIGFGNILAVRLDDFLLLGVNRKERRSGNVPPRPA